MTERQGVEIDYCPKCRGVWLDRGELDKIIERADAGDERSRHPDDDDRGERREHDQQGRHGSRRKRGLADLFDLGG